MEREYVKKRVRDFNLKHIFDCGQCFRWTEEEDGSFTGIAFGKVVNMRKEGEFLFISPCTEQEFQEIWQDYLDLDRDYGRIKEELSAKDEILGRAIEAGEGIRILRQDLWEVILSFIVSQNNNIPRIRSCIAKLSEVAGTEAGTYGGKTWYNLPEPERLAAMTAEELAPVRLGYRAKYLIKTAEQVCERGLPSCYEELLALPGVGPKVANCIALFGLGNMEAFPIDIWVEKVMHELYGIEQGDRKAMAAYAEEHFGNLGGIAQQYLFYYIREKSK